MENSFLGTGMDYAGGSTKSLVWAGLENSMFHVFTLGCMIARQVAR